jgi:hypothetical protein
MFEDNGLLSIVRSAFTASLAQGDIPLYGRIKYRYLEKNWP